MVPKMSSVIVPEEVLAPEPALPSQFHDVWYRTRYVPADRALILAVMWQAVADLQKFRFARRRRQQRMYMEAYRWVASDDREWPFSFANLCDALNLSVESLRVELLSTAPPAPQPAVSEAPADVEEAA